MTINDLKVGDLVVARHLFHLADGMKDSLFLGWDGHYVWCTLMDVDLKNWFDSERRSNDTDLRNQYSIDAFPVSELYKKPSKKEELSEAFHWDIWEQESKLEAGVQMTFTENANEKCK